MEKPGEGEEGSGLRAEEMPVDLTVVKQEVMDWSEMEEGMPNDLQWVKREVKDEPEVKEEKPGALEMKQEMDSSLMVKEETVEEPEVKEEKVNVKEVMYWLKVKEEKKDNLEIKQEEMFIDQNIKKEEIMDEMNVKEEKYLPKEEVMVDTKVKDESQINPPVGSKRKLAMSRVPDDKTINEILRPYIDPEKSDPVIRQRLKAYVRSQTGVHILMKVEHMQQNLVRNWFYGKASNETHLTSVLAFMNTCPPADKRPSSAFEQSRPPSSCSNSGFLDSQLCQKAPPLSPC
ncbi:hypothetical protein CB1_001326007 [Camelus ferus]|nr:hypothetical protein CB1_001326007 [Camelus ferus]